MTDEEWEEDSDYIRGKHHHFLDCPEDEMDEEYLESIKDRRDDDDDEEEDTEDE